MFIGAEITVKEAISLWNERAIFAYDTIAEVDWQINIQDACDQRSVYEILEQEMSNNQDIVLYVETT
jgi:hypothetical protein